jgi:hypothetical protein
MGEEKGWGLSWSLRGSSAPKRGIKEKRVVVVLELSFSYLCASYCAIVACVPVFSAKM